MRYVKGTWVEHPTADWGKGVVLEDTDGPTVLISFENAGIKTLALKHVEPRILAEPLATDGEVERLAIIPRLYIDESFLDIYHDLKSKFPTHLIIIQNGYFYEALEDDAEYLRNRYGWKIHARGNASVTGFPDYALSVWDRLRELRQPFLVLKQLPTEREGCIERQISEIFDGEVEISASHEGSALGTPNSRQVSVDSARETPSVGEVFIADHVLGFKPDKARIRGLLRELQAPIQKPPGFSWEFGGDSWMQLVGNEFDRHRHKNAKFELSALIREYLTAVKATSSDSIAAKVVTQTKNAISENEQFLIFTALILVSEPELGIIPELRGALEAYQSQ